MQRKQKSQLAATFQRSVHAIASLLRLYPKLDIVPTTKFFIPNILKKKTEDRILSTSLCQHRITVCSSNYKICLLELAIE